MRLTIRAARSAHLLAFAAAVLAAAPLAGQAATVPTPESHFGFRPGTDRKLANWDELLSYYEKVTVASPRMTLDTLGLTTRGLPFVMFTITSPENHARLDELLEIQRRLADPRTVASDAELERLKEEARTIVLVTSHIHSTEVGAGQMPANLVYRLASSNDPDVLEILDRVVLLHIPSLNPDGTQMVSNWYQRFVGTEYEAASPVELYHPYVGHDNNRDWYAFTQVETQLTVEKAHNVWRPMIVHDVHQMSATGARIFLPPFVEPVEPNVDPLIVSAINQLGSYMAAELMAGGKTGVVTSGVYDMFTPARAYQHYHGGVRILSETASAQLATPMELPWERLTNGRGFQVRESSVNFPAPWPGGTWGLPDIVDYQESGVMALLKNAARNRRFWVDNFVQINRRATEGWDRWPSYWVLPTNQTNEVGLNAVLRILTMGSVEVHRAGAAFSAAGREFPAGSYVIPMNQPYASWAQTMLEIQEYPDLRDYPGGPPTRPYDVTAHTLPLLMRVDAVSVEDPIDVSLSGPIPQVEVTYTAPAGLSGSGAPRIAMYKGFRESMPAGWTRWVFDQHRGLAYDSIHDADIRRGDLGDRYDVIVFQDQSVTQIVEGWSAGQLPPEYTGGVGEEGLAALREFVEEGGRIIAVEAATDFAIDLFGLPVTNRVAGVPPAEFYIPGAILRLNLAPGTPLAAGVDPATIAWYGTQSRAFDVGDPAVNVLARYGEGDPRLSGWVLGADRIAGEPAIVEAKVGRGSVVLFGFQPNYRAQTIATWPLLFNAMSVERR